MDIIEIVKEHLLKYPLMEPFDIIKLIYQNEFGGGHMIDLVDDSFLRLKDECRSLKDHDLNIEPIGDHLIRVNLSKLSLLQIESLNQIFVASSKIQNGNLASFINKLETVKQAMLDHQIDYDYNWFNRLLKEYEQMNFPPVSHSEQYRKLYHPHYRVVDRRYFEYFDLIVLLNQLLKQKDSLNIAIDGKCGAGKSFLGLLLQTIFDANLFKMDDFFLRPFQRTESRLKQPGGNVDYERFKDTVIDPLIKKQSVAYQRFDCSKMALDNDVQIIDYKKINIIEGTYSMHPYFNHYYDFSIGLYLDDKLQQERIMQRNGKLMYQKFAQIWIPLENKYFDTYQIFNQVDYLKVFKK